MLRAHISLQKSHEILFGSSLMDNTVQNLRELIRAFRAQRHPPKRFRRQQSFPNAIPLDAYSIRSFSNAILLVYPMKGFPKRG